MKRKIFILALSVLLLMPCVLRAEENEITLMEVIQIISVDIYSMTGQLLRACDGAKPNLQGLPAGTYMVVYNSNNNSITQKLVLQ